MRWTTSDPRITHSRASRHGGAVELEHEPQAGRVEEAHAAQVEDDFWKPDSRSRIDLGLELVDRRDVELADRSDAHGLARGLHVDAERLELSRQRVRLAAGHFRKVNLDGAEARAGWPVRCVRRSSARYVAADPHPQSKPSRERGV